MASALEQCQPQVEGTEGRKKKAEGKEECEIEIACRTVKVKVSVEGLLRSYPDEQEETEVRVAQIRQVDQEGE